MAERLREVLDECIRSNDKTGILSLVELLRDYRLAQIFGSVLSAQDRDSKTQTLISDLIKLPDRLSNILAGGDIPPQLNPSIYTSIILSNLAVSISETKPGDVSLNPEHISFLLSKLFLNYKEQVPKPLLNFFRFCLGWIDERGSENTPNLIQRIFSCLDLPTLEKCFLSALDLDNPADIFVLLGPVFKPEKTYKIIENNLFLRGIKVEDKLKNLVGYLHIVDTDLISKILSRALLLFVDQIYVDHGEYRDQLILCKLICCCFSFSTEYQISQIKSRTMLLITKGTVHWFDSTPAKRNLGMIMVLVILTRLGEDKVPDWEIQDQDMLRKFKLLASPDTGIKTRSTLSSSQVLSEWREILCSSTSPSSSSSSPLSSSSSSSIVSAVPVVRAIPVIKNYNPNPMLLGKKEEVLDSDDEDEDDDLPAFNMSNDTKVEEREKKIYYLRDAIDEIANPESDYTEHCLSILPDLCTRHLKHEDPALVQHLIKVVLFSQNRFGTAEWTKLRESAMLSVVETKPVESARCLIPAFYDKNNPLDTRFAILSWIKDAAPSICKLYSGKPEFTDYIKICVQGLCGGASWSKLEFTGLETHNVSRLLITIGELLHTGKNILGWDQLAADYLELVLFTASSGRQVLQATCLHSISLVLALVEPYMVPGLEEVLDRVGTWLGSRTGELEEQGGKTLLGLLLLRQEARKQEISHQLSGVSTISLKTPAVKISF